MLLPSRTCWAQEFLKTLTLDRSWKGTDHAFSLEPQGLSKMIRNLIESLMIGSKNKKLLNRKKTFIKNAKINLFKNGFKKGPNYSLNI